VPSLRWKRPALLGRGGEYDIVVIGGGHNGLAAAAYASRAGRSVLVLETRHILGGFATTEATVPQAPGYLMNPYAADFVLGNIPPTVDDELDLAREGLRWVRPDPFYSYLDPDGGSFAFWRDASRTVSEIRRFSPVDARQYERFTEVLRDLWLTIYPYLQGHPVRVRPAAVAHIVSNLARRRGNLGIAARMMMSSPGAIIEEWFESRQLQAAMANFAVATMCSLDEPGSGIIMSMMALQHQWGVRRPIGGIGAFSQALAACARRHGTEIRTGTAVESIELTGNRANGVRLVDGSVVTARSVLCTLDPWTMCNRLLPSGALPDSVHRELRGMSVLRNNISAFKGDVAVAAPLSLSRHGRERELLPSVMLMAPSLEYVRRSTNAGLRGELTEEIPLWLAVPSVIDRTLVPEGSPGESLYVFLPAVPHELAGGVEWAGEKDKHLDRCLSIIEDYLPGLSGNIIGAQATSPDDLEKVSGIHKGHLFHADMTMSQFGPWRPVPSLAGYTTPVDGLLHAGAGNHPMGTVCGWSGRSAARLLTRDRWAAPRARTSPQAPT
jgi:beta-carotene ketolase (CrtO type)